MNFLNLNKHVNIELEKTNGDRTRTNNFWILFRIFGNVWTFLKEIKNDSKKL